MKDVGEALDALNAAIERFEDVLDLRFRSVNGVLEIRTNEVSGVLSRRMYDGEWGLWWTVGEETRPLANASMLVRVMAAQHFCYLVDILRASQTARLAEITAATARVVALCDELYEEATT